MMVTWKDLIKEAMMDFGESWADVVEIKPKSIDLDRHFNATSDRVEGKPFRLWTNRRVYFSCTSDGIEWVASVSRDPSGGMHKHIGDEI